jgi:hypothetical protein
MTQIVVHGPHFVRQGYSMGDTVPVPSSSFEILFYRLQATVSSQSFLLLDGNGVYTAYRRIADFISDIEAAIPNGSFPPHTSLHNGVGDHPYDIVITGPCYVIVAISSDDKPTLTFADDVPALKTAEDHSALYHGLSRADSEQGCKIVYFQVFHPRTSGDDDYNLYMQYGTKPNVEPWTYDPKIKNRGTVAGTSARSG